MAQPNPNPETAVERHWKRCSCERPAFGFVVYTANRRPGIELEDSYDDCIEESNLQIVVSLTTRKAARRLED